MRSRILDSPKRSRLLQGRLSKSEVVGMIKLQEAILETSRKTGKSVVQVMDETIGKFFSEIISEDSSF